MSLMRLRSVAGGLASDSGGAAAAAGASRPNPIDTVRPDAPALAEHGEYTVGVRALAATNPGQLDAVATIDADAERFYDRQLALEVWYPAAADAMGPTTYEGVLLRVPTTAVQLSGIAHRDATPLRGAGPFPLIIISHGYPGNRFLLAHLGENLASKGYVVVSIDHTDSTYDNQAAFGSTLLNRPLDQKFVLDHVTTLGVDPAHFLGGLVDTAAAGLIGYSMGGYGAMITAGGGVTQTAVDKPGRPRLAMHLAGSAEHLARHDPRFKAVLAFAPWGMTAGFWDAEGLRAVKTPVFFVAGSLDTTSGYENGVAALFEQSTNVDRVLLTYENAGHNAGAPMPAPAEAWETWNPAAGEAAARHYADDVWDSVRMNNIAQHFATAWFGAKVKGDAGMEDYMQEGAWKGFEGDQMPGLSLRRMDAGS
jgi:predicted dienelactone hydrolase